ncbi:MAG: hypothetical protein LBR05_00525 [Azoarcus sp.]|nr:hypothetical protein [Azoarcus sp.]
MNTSQHATVRLQQRGISPLVVDLLRDFGKSVPAGDGASKLFFDKAARKKLKAYAGSIARFLEEHLNVYAVVAADDRLITVGHLYERVRRH